MNSRVESGLRDIVDQSPEGIVVCDATAADCPVVYANAAFLQLSGYPLSALLGRNLRLLQGNDQDQEGRQRIREALARGESCRVMMRNYRLDGTQFWNEILIQPVRDAAGTLVQWIGYHRDTRERLRAPEKLALAGLPAWMREDRLTGPAGQNFCLRFHLHPAVQVSLIQDGAAALLRLPGGFGWRLRAQGAVIGIAESVYLGGETLRKSRQLVLDGHVGSGGAVVKWALKREQKIEPKKPSEGDDGDGE